MKRVKIIPIKDNIMALCSVRTARAADLTREETRSLMSWCDWQHESLWDSMTLQEILNVYRATAEWDTFESWAEEDRKAAHAAWNRAVISPGNRMPPNR